MRHAIAVSCLATVLVGCATAPVIASRPAQTTVHAHEPLVPRGTHLRARVESTLDTASARRGQPFTAEIVDPLVSGNGSVVVPAGARVHGHVVAVTDNGDTRRLQIAFDSIDTVAGTVPLSARLEHAESSRYRGVRHERMVPTASSFGMYEHGSPYWSDTWAPIGGGPVGWAVQPYRPNEVRVANGAMLTLVLAAPLSPTSR